MTVDALARIARHNPRRALARAQSACMLMAGTVTVCMSAAIVFEGRVISVEGDSDSPYVTIMRHHQMLVSLPACIFLLCVTLTAKNRGRIRRLVGEWGLQPVRRAISYRTPTYAYGNATACATQDAYA